MERTEWEGPNNGRLTSGRKVTAMRGKQKTVRTGCREWSRVEPDGTQGTLSVAVLESTGGDSADKVIIWNYLSIRV
jgi:hypothetical protein